MTSNPEPGLVYCMKCVHHFITWEPGFPYGCRAMNFKSRRLPQYEVASASHQMCQFFQPRADRAG